MTTNLTVPLTPEVFTAIQVAAVSSGRTASEEAAEALVERYGAEKLPASMSEVEARLRLRRHFGSIDMGAPIGIDNEAIDADLAKQYGSTNE